MSFQIGTVCAVEYAVAIPVSKNPQNNEWSVLLGLQNGQWWPFRAPIQHGESADAAAQKALSAGTNGMYVINVQGMPMEEMYNLTYYIVPVPIFIRGNDLYTNGRTPQVSDFVWIPVNQLLQKGPVKPKPNANTIVAKEFLHVFQTIWPKKVSALEQPKSKAITPDPWKQYVPQATSWQNIPGAIYFYQSNKPYYEFTNFYEQDITVDGKVWPTTEQYYQASKFTDPNLQNIIQKFKSDSSGSAPRKAFDFANKNKQSLRPDWYDVNLDNMRKAIYEKFAQYPQLATMLLQTGNAILVEDAGKNDSFFGAGDDYLGQNWLGRILMEVRAELQKKAVQATVAPQPTTQTSTQPSLLGASPLAQSLDILQKNLNILEATLSSSKKK